MSDLIDRQAAIESLLEKGQCSRRYKVGEIWELNFDEIREVLNSLPSAEPERKTGHWIITEGEYMHSGKYRCSECGHQFRWIYDRVFPPVFNYCKNCGARMKKDYE